MSVIDHNGSEYDFLTAPTPHRPKLDVTTISSRYQIDRAMRRLLHKKPSWRETEKGLDKIADTLGRTRLAREIEAEEITEVIRPIYERGARAMADHVRGYIRAAYGWGMGGG